VHILPFKSEAQERLMNAAAHTPGGYGGVSKNVGQKLEEHSDSNYSTVKTKGRAAGIIFHTADDEVLLLHRGNGGDYPNTFGLPGGLQNANEEIEDTARREALEETGFNYTGSLELLHDNGQYATYLAKDIEKFEIVLCNESSGFLWCKMSEFPTPLHPGLQDTLKIAGIKTELDAAKLMSEGIIPSPHVYGNMHLLAVRITGTGLAYRSSIGEHVWRDPSIYLNDEFLARCNGLTVIMDHPDGAILTTDEYKTRAIGSIMLSYIKGDEVWGIARIHDTNAMKEIAEGYVSTSPCVTFDELAGNVTVHTESGEPILIEGKPCLLDHLAIVTKSQGSAGVWDKGGPLEGVQLNNKNEVLEMTEKTLEPKVDAAGDKLDSILSALGQLVSRVDSMEKNMPAPELKGYSDEEEMSAMDKKKSRKDDENKKEEEEEEVRKDSPNSTDGKQDMRTGQMRPDAEKEEEEARKDADKETEEVARRDKDMEKYADFQAMADTAYAAFGNRAPAPLMGQSLTGYRNMLLRPLQTHSKTYKDVDLKSVSDSNLLSVIEKHIYADAIAASNSPEIVPEGRLIRIVRKDSVGREIVSYKGSPKVMLKESNFHRDSQLLHISRVNRFGLTK